MAYGEREDEIIQLGIGQLEAAYKNVKQKSEYGGRMEYRIATVSDCEA